MQDKPKQRASAADKHIGRRVRMRRMMLGMSQEKLADAIDLTFQQVQKYEKGANRIGSGRLAQIAAALDVPVAFFFEDLQTAGAAAEGPSPAGELTTAFFSIPHASQLAQAFTRLAPEQRRVVLDVALALNPAQPRARVQKVA